MDPVGVAQTTPSHPHRDNGRPSISMTTSTMRSPAPFSTVASFSAHVRAISAVRARHHVQGHPRLDRVPPVDEPVDGLGQLVYLGLGEEADMPEVDPDQRGTHRPGELGGARSRDPSPPRTITVSAPLAASGPGGTTVMPGQAIAPALGFR